MTRYLLDTNVLIATLVDEPGRGTIATELLNMVPPEEMTTSLLNVMEARTVLAKKKRVEQDEVNEVLGEIVAEIGLLFPETHDLLTANNRQVETLLYPMDAILLSVAENNDMDLVTFDGELLDNGARTPESVLDSVDGSDG